MLKSKSGADVSVDISDINVIEIVKESKLLTGVGLGLLIGGGSGYLIGREVQRPEGVAGMFAFIGITCLGVIAGAVIGGAVGVDRMITIYGMSQDELEPILQELRSKARVPDYK